MTATALQDTGATKHHLFQEEKHTLAALRAACRRHHAKKNAAAPEFTLGERVADTVAAAVGSRPFILIQSIIRAIWIVLNVIAFVSHWDPYPFILLNLALSFRAAYAAPFIMMSQNRQAAIDRRWPITTTRSTSRLSWKSNAYALVLPPANHVFLPGHRIMVQLQSSWFPLYDRNPQTFVPNIFWAKPADYKAQTITVMDAGAITSALTLPVVQ